MKLIHAQELKPGKKFQLPDNPLSPLRTVLETQLLREKIEIVTTEGEHFHFPLTDLVRVKN